MLMALHTKYIVDIKQISAIETHVFVDTVCIHDS